MAFSLIPTDIGYIALLTMLVILPTVAVGAAVIDRTMKRRRDGRRQKSESPMNAFPVIADPSVMPERAPQPVQPIRK